MHMDAVNGLFILKLRPNDEIFLGNRNEFGYLSTHVFFFLLTMRLMNEK